MRVFQRARTAAAAALALAMGLVAAPASGLVIERDGDAQGDGPAVNAVSAVWDSSIVHTISVDLDEQAYRDMVSEYVDTGAKNWIEADVTIDGREFPRSGMKLKGNSSLFGITPDTPPTTASWAIRLDKYVEQDLDGYYRFAVRTNETATHLNEALALRLLAEADVPTGRSFPSSFSVNGAAAELRLIAEDMVDEFDHDYFGDDGGTLYKKAWEGDFSYLGTDPADYEDYYWEPKGGKEGEWQPLFSFLDWMNNSTDAEFASGLASRVETDSWARYLAVEDILRNWDDFDGPGQNGYLRYSPGTGKMTVVAWDHNLSLGAFAFPPGGGGGGWPPPDGVVEKMLPQRGDGARTAAAAADPPPQRTTWGFPLTQRAFELDPGFVATYESELARLDQELVRSGRAEAILAELAAPLASSGLVTADQVSRDRQQIMSVLNQQVTPRDPGDGGGFPSWPPEPTSTPTPTPSPTPTGTTPSPTRATGGCTATLTVVNSWGGGYQAAVRVTAGSAAIPGWTTSFGLGSSTMSQGWNAQFTTSGSQVTASDVGWNGNLGAGASTEFGFIGAGSAPSSTAVTCTAG